MCVIDVIYIYINTLHNSTHINYSHTFHTQTHNTINSSGFTISV